MLVKLGLRIKGAMGGQLSYAEMATLIESSLNPPREAEWFGESDWKAVTGRDGVAEFTEHWRNSKLLPHLRAIADQPTPTLQRWKIRDLLLDEQETADMCLKALMLSKEEAEAVLIGDRTDTTGGQCIERKRNQLGLEFVFFTYNHTALLELARKGFGINVKKLEHWLFLYSEAYKFILSHRLLLRTLHVTDPQCYTYQDSLAAEAAAEPMFTKMTSLLSAMRDNITSGRCDVERHRQLYNALVDAKDDLLRPAGLRARDGRL
jgi:hypothetical protein